MPFVLDRRQLFVLNPLLPKLQSSLPNLALYHHHRSPVIKRKHNFSKVRLNPLQSYWDQSGGGGSELPTSHTLNSQFPHLPLWFLPLCAFFYCKILCNVAPKNPISPGSCHLGNLSSRPLLSHLP